jgi:hypothetical protein
MANRTNKPTDARNHQVGQDHDSVMPSSGRVQMPDNEIEPVEGPSINDKVKLEAFMHEPVDVMVSESSDENAEDLVTIYVGGVPQRFIRGKLQTVKRKFVEGLARAKPTRINTQEFTNNQGIRDVKIRRSTGLRYPFSVMHDPNPNGPAWLRKVLGEP